MPSKANDGEITLDLSAAACPAAGERQEDDQGGMGGSRGGGTGRGRP